MEREVLVKTILSSLIVDNLYASLCAEYVKTLDSDEEDEPKRRIVKGFKLAGRCDYDIVEEIILQTLYAFGLSLFHVGQIIEHVQHRRASFGKENEMQTQSKMQQLSSRLSLNEILAFFTPHEDHEHNRAEISEEDDRAMLHALGLLAASLEDLVPFLHPNSNEDTSQNMEGIMNTNPNEIKIGNQKEKEKEKEKDRHRRTSSRFILENVNVLHLPQTLLQQILAVGNLQNENWMNDLCYNEQWTPFLKEDGIQIYKATVALKNDFHYQLFMTPNPENPLEKCVCMASACLTFKDVRSYAWQEDEHQNETETEKEKKNEKKKEDRVDEKEQDQVESKTRRNAVQLSKRRTQEFSRMISNQKHQERADQESQARLKLDQEYQDILIRHTLKNIVQVFRQLYQDDALAFGNLYQVLKRQCRVKQVRATPHFS